MQAPSSAKASTLYIKNPGNEILVPKIFTDSKEGKISIQTDDKPPTFLEKIPHTLSTGTQYSFSNPDRWLTPHAQM